MIYPKYLKSKLIAATCTLLIHVLLFGLLSIDFSGDQSSKLSDTDLDALQLDMDFSIPEEMLKPEGKDPLAKDQDKGAESISKGKGTSKPKSSEPERTPEDQEMQALQNPDTIVIAKKDMAIEVKKDTLAFNIKDSALLAEIIGLQKTNKKVTSKNKVVMDNKARFEFYQKNVKNIRNFKKVYPYALKIKQLTDDLNKQLSTMSDENAKEKLIKQTEKVLFKEYEAAVRTMTRSQGNLLLKLVARETNKTGYDIIKEYKGAFPASFWYGVGKIFGQDLKAEYHKEQEDSLIENILDKYKNDDLY